MSVSIRQLQGGAAAANLFTSFSTNFPSITNLRQDFVAYGITGRNITVAANRLNFNADATGGGEVLCLIPVRAGGIRGRNQFSQATYAADTGTGANPSSPSLFVFTNAINSVNNNVFVGYCVTIARNVPNTRIFRTNNFTPAGTVTAVTLATLGSVPAFGDVMRLEGRIVGADTVLDYFVNGVNVLSGTDVGVTNPLSMPGIGSRVNDSPASTFSFELFSCGIL